MELAELIKVNLRFIKILSAGLGASFVNLLFCSRVKSLYATFKAKLLNKNIPDNIKCLYFLVNNEYKFMIGFDMIEHNQDYEKMLCESLSPFLT